MLRYRIAGIFVLVAFPALAAEPDQLRDAEGYALPKGATARLGSMRLQHDKPVIAATFSPDGKRIISVGKDQTLRVWDTDTGKAVATWPLTSASEPTGVTLSRKGDAALVPLMDGKIDVYELDGGKKRFALPAAVAPKRPAYPPVSALVVGEDDKSALTLTTDGSVTLYDLTAGKLTKSHTVPGFANRPLPVALAPNAKSFAHEVADRKEVVFFDAVEGKETSKLNIQQDGGRFAAAALAFSPDGKQLVTLKDQKLGVWDIEKGKLLVSRPGSHLGSVGLVSPDGRLVVMRPSPTFEAIHGTTSGLELRRVTSPSAKIARIVAISPDSKRALRINAQSNRVYIWDFEEERELLSPESMSVTATHFEWLAGGVLVARSGYTAKAFDVATGKPVGEVTISDGKALPGNVAVTEDGKGLTWAIGHTVHIWQPGQPVKTTVAVAGDNEPEAPLPGAFPQPVRPTPRSIGGLISPNGRYYAYFPAADNLKIRDLTTGNEIEITRTRPGGLSTANVRASGFSPDSKHLFGFIDGRLNCWETATGKRRDFSAGEFERSANELLGFTCDGRCAVFGGLGHVQVCEMCSGTPRARVTFERIDGPTPKFGVPTVRTELSFAVSADGLLLARATAEGIVKIVPLSQNINVNVADTIQPGQGRITALSFSPDGKRLVTAGDNGTVLFWDVPPRWKERKVAQKLQKTELPQLWSDLYNREATYAFGVMYRLVAEPDVAIPLLREKLKERPAADEKQVAAWIAEVIAGKRHEALDDIIEAGPEVSRDLVIKALGELTKENRNFIYQRLSPALESDNRLLAKRDVRRIRAIEILEWIGTAEARELLEPLAKGPADSAVTQHAKAALARMAPPK